MKQNLFFSTVIAACMSMSACVEAPVRGEPHYDHVRHATMAPPPPRHENPGLPPHIGHIWIDGTWNWSGDRYVWVPGRWEEPRHGHTWQPYRWERDGDHWRQHGGQWEPHARVEPPPPYPAPEHRHDLHVEQNRVGGNHGKPPVTALKPEPKMDAKPQAKPEPKIETKPQVKPEPKIEVKPQGRPEVKIEVKQQAKPEAKIEVRLQTKPDHDPHKKNDEADHH